MGQSGREEGRLKRLPDWRSRLFAYVDEVKLMPYDEAKHNCGLFPAGAVKAITGVDYAAPYRKLKTLPGQLRRMRREGFANHVELAASLFQEIHPSQARMGDLAAFKADDDIGVALGVVISENVFVLRRDGLGTLPLLSADRAFRI